MKKLLLFALLFVLTASSSFAQYNNEWINYSKPYYKFTIGPLGYDNVAAPVKNGVVRIPQSSLAAAGLAGTPAEYLQLWRNGVEVPIFTSQPAGVLGSDDYIEFWGAINDGKPDKKLYTDSSYQLSDYWSLQADSVAYFLTVNANGNNKRLQWADNNVSSATIAPEKNFMYTVGRYYHAEINRGFAAVSTEYLYSSAYEKGEGWTSRPVHPNECPCRQKQLPQIFQQLFLDTTGAAMTAYVSSVGNALSNRIVKLFLNNDSLTSYSMNYFSDAKKTTSISANFITNDTALFIVQDISDNPNDEMRVATISLNYPRFFNFGNASNFPFTLAASDTGRYIIISNFNKGNALPILYDIDNGKKYAGDTTESGYIKFLLLPSTIAYNLALVRSDGSTATIVNTLQQRVFVDYSQQGNQGNYLIISNPILYSGDSNYVEQYRAYRSSAAGGSFNTKIIDIGEITDQFAYGIKKHPLSIKNFLAYARNNFAIKPENLFLVGKGLTYEGYKLYEGDALTDQLDLVPTWGYPGSDNMLSSVDTKNPVPLIATGRLSAVNFTEVKDYLNKVREHEAVQQHSPQTVKDKGWMKNVIQIAGGSDAEIGSTLDTYMDNYTKIISDTSFGGVVTNFSKSANPAAYPQAIASFKSIYERGSGLVEYFGHSSATSLDFSLDDPQVYNNTGKYPFFIVNGCLAGNIFDYDFNRLNNRTTISEKFVLAPQKGAIGYLATCSYGVLSYLNIFTNQFYNAISKTDYGKSFGVIIKDGISKALQLTGANDFYGRTHAEQYTFHGDPALKLNNDTKPDYTIEKSLLNVNPSTASVADDSVAVNVRIYNLGKATKDSVHFTLYKKLSATDSLPVYSKTLASVKSVDSFTVNVPVVGNRDKGTVQLTAVADDGNHVAEIAEDNNVASTSFTVNDLKITPVYPYNYSIVNTDTVSLIASTADPLEGSKNYIMELDTTVLFNSPFKQHEIKSSTGGTISFDKTGLPENERVYYWRVARDSSNPVWSVASFTRNDTTGKGFEQAHFYQHLNSLFDRVVLDSSTRSYKFTNKLTNFFIQHSIYPTSGYQDNQFSISVNGSFLTWSACVGSSIIFNVFDTLTLKPMENTTNPFGAGAVCDTLRKYNFEYSTQSPAARNNAVQFLDAVPAGSYVIVRKIYDLGNADWAPTVWANDTTIYGAGNSLYNRFKDQGLQIDSFYRPRTFVFVYKKDDSAHFSPVSIFSQGLYDRISFTQNLSSHETEGTVTSPVFGPAKSWNTITWNGFSLDDNDYKKVDVIGVNSRKGDSVLYTLDSGTHSLNISNIDVGKYRYLKLRLHTSDIATASPYQLQQWQVLYKAEPEGAVSPNLGIDIPEVFTFNHPVNQYYDSLTGYVVFKNISDVSFQKIKLKFVLYDSVDTPHIFILPDTRTLHGGDTLHISFLASATNLPEGKYNLFLEVNPANNQPEQYHFNNFLYKYVYINRGGIELPVRLITFTAKPQGVNVLLQWHVVNETNFNHYEIEHSLDAVNFSNIGSVTAIHNNSSGNYSFTHYKPNNGINYYRLKMIDNDGSFTYSSIKQVTISNSYVQVYPNPFADKLYVSVTTQNIAGSKVLVFNNAGQKIMQQTFKGSTTLNLSKLAAGVYMVQVDDGLQVRTFKVQKQ